MARSVLLLCLAVAVVACADERPPGLGDRPDAAVLTFDPRMLESMDAGRPRTDSGANPDFGRDAGNRDLGQPDLGVEFICRGIARSCLSAGLRSSCEDIDGCRWEGDCSGVSTSCFSLFDRFTCDRQRGCFWSTLSDSCTGSVWSCSLLDEMGECTRQRGCRYEEECDGVSRGCILFFDEVSCLGQPGCRWEPR